MDKEEGIECSSFTVVTFMNILSYDVEWDRNKNLANIRKHGVDFTFASDVFGDPWSSTQSGTTDIGLYRQEWQRHRKGESIMDMVRKTVIVGEDPELTPEEIEMLKQAARRPIHYDKDCPRLTRKQLADFKPAHPELYRPRKEQITLKIDADVLQAFRNMGKGYQTKINAALRKAVFGDEA